jgi:hypothetical protein
MSSVPQLSLTPKIVVGSLTLKRPEGRAPTSRQLVDALSSDRGQRAISTILLAKPSVSDGNAQALPD